MKSHRKISLFPAFPTGVRLFVLLAVTIGVGRGDIHDCCSLALAHPYDQAFFEPQTSQERKPFFTEDTPYQYGRSRAIDIKHIKLEIALDIPEKKLMGTAEITFSPINDDLSKLELDAVGMQISAVSMGDLELAHEYDGQRLTMALPALLKAVDERVIRIDYTAIDAKGFGGVNFIGPDKSHPEKPVEVWTQGEPEMARQWMPCFDAPCELQTSELSITVPASFIAVSNGELIDVEALGSNRRFHWKHDVPHVSYLMMFAAGEFVEMRDSWREIPVTCFCHAGEEEFASNVVGVTPEIIDCYVNLFGVPYPYAKYSQIFVHDFPAGGMENTSATILSRNHFHDDRMRIDSSTDGVVAHELAHQWFGNLLTCRDWSHLWLNEGFACYCECLWQEHARGATDYQYTVFERMKAVLDQDRNRYRRPLVCNRYKSPWAMFDTHSYQKGAIVLHMLRQELGDAAFFKAIKHYLETRRGTAVVTNDFAKAIEDATGCCPDRFFGQWVYGAGQPHIQYEYSYYAASKTCDLVLRQIQANDGMTAAAFHCQIQVAFNRLMGDGDTASLTRCLEDVTLTQREQHVRIPIESAPDFVTLDVGNRILKEIDYSKISDREFALQLRHEPDFVTRLCAVRELGARMTADASAALMSALATDDVWQVRMEAAVFLGKMQDDNARDALIAAMNDEHPRVRLAIMKALGSFAGDAKAADALLAAAKLGDESCLVEAACIEALGKYRDEHAREPLRGILKDRDSYREMLRIAAVKALAEYGDSSDTAIIKGYTASEDPYLRAAATEALAVIARKTGEIAHDKEEASDSGKEQVHPSETR